ncbi:hypothetical protein [Streptomyces sp. NPDC018055]|uniref:hypothetical protein n=1 Tax=Streptomyces sp. NPDC018055 TaxID=3365038 RepID=UPI00378DE60F
MPQTTQPLIIDPPPPPRGAPRAGDYRLYDEDFPVETNPKYRTVGPKHEDFGTAPPLRTPHFPIGQVATWVFGKKPQWIKDRIKGIAPITYDGNVLVIRQIPSGRATGDERRLTLADIERLAWALYERNWIDGFQLQHASEIVVAVARQYGVGDVEETGAP